MTTSRTTDQWEQELRNFGKPVIAKEAQQWIRNRVLIGVDAILELIRIRKALETLTTINKHDEGLCQNCGLPLPGGAPHNMKYCRITCRQRAYEDRMAANQITRILKGENP